MPAACGLGRVWSGTKEGRQIWQPDQNRTGSMQYAKEVQEGTRLDYYRTKLVFIHLLFI